MARQGLTSATVIETAADVADEVGLERLTLALVAERSGVSLPALYKHVDGLEAARRGVALLSVAELTERMTAVAAGRAGRDALAAIAGAYRDYAVQHPGRYAASTKAPAVGDTEHELLGAAAVALIEAALAGYGTVDVHAIRYVRSVLHGFVSLETGGGFGMPVSLDTTFAACVDAMHAALTNWSTT